jgi:hypothetical protein
MIVDSVQQLESLYGRNFFVYPVLQDSRRHRVSSEIVAVVLIDLQTHQTFSVAKSHPDAVFQVEDYSFLNKCSVYSYDTILFKYAGYDTSRFVDAQLQYYLKTNQSCNFETPAILNHYARFFTDCAILGSLVSLPKHESIAYNLYERIYIPDLQPGLEFYQHKLLDSFFNIERSGIKVDQELFVNRFGKTFALEHSRCFTQYNYYTTTGRPSNRFGGINFAALNKEDGTRECFVSDHKDGELVEIDFNSYHPRLIASLVGYDFGSEDVYEHLAKHYHNTQTPTKSQILQAKEATFRQIYGGINKQYLHVPFFKAVNDLAYQLWNYAQEHGYVQSPISGRKLILANYQDITLYTLFNYFIQMYETEFNVLMLEVILAKLSSKRSKAVLYTYDSVLFDVPDEERDYLLKEVLPSAIDVSKFPIKTKAGINYGNLIVC